MASRIEDGMIEAELERLRGTCLCDFAALAWIGPEHRARWLYASGNSNERYRSVNQKASLGLIGRVLRIGRPIQYEQIATDPMLRDSPIVLAERLQAAAANPVCIRHETRGVLVLAHRSQRRFERAEREQLERSARTMETLCRHLL